MKSALCSYQYATIKKELTEVHILLLAKDISPPKPSLLLLEMVEFGELLSPSPSDSPGSLRLLGRNGRCALL